MNWKQLPLSSINWSHLDSFSDRTFSQTKKWLEFLQKITRGEIIICSLNDETTVKGYFTGIRFKKFALPILGSPFPGWTTPYMGFNLSPEIPRRNALQSFESFAFSELGVQHLEINDRFLTREETEGLGYRYRSFFCYLTDLSPSEDMLFKKMKSSCQRCIRKANKEGVFIEEAPKEGFADIYYEQLIDVFKKQGLRPTYSKERVQAVIDHYYDSGNMLLLRAINKNKKIIATAIYTGINQFSYFWGNASLREYQNVRPNEALHWHALKYWKSRGMRWHDWGGEGEYKKKYGVTPFEQSWFYKSKYPFIHVARDVAYDIYYAPRLLLKKFFHPSGK